jgi:hypothetical protein
MGCSLVMSIAARLSTQVSYDQVAGIYMSFLSRSPSKMSIEKAVLVLGRYAPEWFERCSSPSPGGRRRPRDPDRQQGISNSHRVRTEKTPREDGQATPARVPSPSWASKAVSAGSKTAAEEG